MCTGIAVHSSAEQTGRLAVAYGQSAYGQMQGWLFETRLDQAGAQLIGLARDGWPRTLPPHSRGLGDLKLGLEEQTHTHRHS